MDTYSVVKTLHIISATVLFGTGMGIAFFMVCSAFGKNLHEKYFAARFTVLADFIFTTPAVIIQPLTGMYLIAQGGFDPAAFWLKATYGLYILAGICWLPVVWIQLRLRNIIAATLQSAENGQEKSLPREYGRLFKIWFCLGWPAFGALIAIFWLMVTKPV